VGRRRARDDPVDDLIVVAARSANAITNRLKRAIETGVFSDGDQLPPERQLAISLGTARSTIRKALDQLESQNWSSGGSARAPS
jgi:DNA-binding FadR family transcriptional regulator